MEEAGSSNLPKPILFRATNRRAKRVAVAREQFVWQFELDETQHANVCERDRLGVVQICPNPLSYENNSFQ